MSAWQIGRVMSVESRAKMSAAKKGKVPTKAIEASAKANKGRPKSAEQRAKQAAAVRGRHFPKRSIALLRALIAGGHPSSSGVRGVRETRSGRVEARLRANGKCIQIGTFATREEAEARYVEAVEARISELEFQIAHD
jgi:hypothetical protein